MYCFTANQFNVPNSNIFGYTILSQLQNKGLQWELSRICCFKNDLLHIPQYDNRALGLPMLLLLHRYQLDIYNNNKI